MKLSGSEVNEGLSPTDFNFISPVEYPKPPDDSTVEGQRVLALLSRIGISWQDFCATNVASILKESLTSAAITPFRTPHEDFGSDDEYLDHLAKKARSLFGIKE